MKKKVSSSMSSQDQQHLFFKRPQKNKSCCSSLKIFRLVNKIFSKIISLNKNSLLLQLFHAFLFLNIFIVSNDDPTNNYYSNSNFVFVKNVNAQQGGGGPQYPPFFTTELKDEWGELDSADWMGDEACKKRLQILKTMGTISNPGITQYKVVILEDLGYCAYWQEDWKMAQMRFKNAVDELETVTRQSSSEFLKNPQLQQFAPIVFHTEAADALYKSKYSAAAMLFRRIQIVALKNFDKEIKMIVQAQNMATKDEIKKDFEKVKQRVMPQLMQHKPFQSHTAKIQMLQEITGRIDQSSGYNVLRKKLLSENKFFSGLLYPNVPWQSGLSQLLEDVKELKFPKDLKEGKQIPLITPKKSGDECDKAIWPEFCEWLKGKKYAADITTNVLGSTKILNAKDMKKPTKLESCESNASIGLLWSQNSFKIKSDAIPPVTKDGIAFPEIDLTVKPEDEKSPSVAYLIDYCRSLEISDRQGPVLFIQLWHPETAPIERTTMIRTTLTGSDKKTQADALAKLVNSGTMAWEKTNKAWKSDSALYDSYHAITDIMSAKKKAVLNESVKKSQEQAELNEEERQNAVKKLEEERIKKEKIEQEKAELRKKRQAEMAAKKKAASPWVDTPIKLKDKETGKKYETTLKEQEDKLEALKAEKRELDRQLEFGQANDLVKDINAQDRVVKSAEKQAKKAYEKLQKGGGDAKKEEKVKDSQKDDEKTKQKTEKAEDEKIVEKSKDTDSKKQDEKKEDVSNVKVKDTTSEIKKKAVDPAALEKELETAKESLSKEMEIKSKAIAAEDYKKAKQQKKIIDDLNSNIKRLEGELASISKSKEEL